MKPNHKLIDYDEITGSVIIVSDLTKSFVMDVLSCMSDLKFIKTVDLSQVNMVDTSALALLVECQKMNQNQIQIINSPKHLLNLAKVVGLSFLFSN